MTPPRMANLSRRGFVFLAAAASAQVRRTAPSERVRYPDAGTEFEVLRLTDPKQSASALPPPNHHIFARRGNFLLYTSDRGGVRQAWALDLKNWSSRALTQAKAIESAWLGLTADERSLLYGEEGALWIQPVAGGPARKLYTFAAKPGPGIGVTPEGHALVGEENKLRSVLLLRGTASTIVEAKGPVSDPLQRPKRASALYRAAGGLWLAHLDGQRNFALKTAAGEIGQARWAPDGRTVLYLLKPEAPAKQVELRENDPDTGEDKLIGRTSQFAAFSCNSDASVFAGASASKAGPYVLLLVRAVAREMALCEHKAADPVSVSPVFTPDSQAVIFQSDLHGKPALYMMDVRKLVEKTDS